MKNEKYILLRKGILFDLIGMISLVIPFLGPFLDLIWAPIAAKKMTEMYQGRQGKIAAVIVFIEEILPGLDFIPTFTLMWLYTFVFKKDQPGKLKTIKVKVND